MVNIMINNETVGNISTIIKYASMLLTGWTISILANHGLNIQGQEQYLTELITIILFFLLAHIDAKYKNTFFNNQEKYNENIEEENDDTIMEEL